jgi:hypothetical protein
MKDFLLNTLFKPVSASVVSTFRILFGSLLFLEMLYFWRIGFVPFGLTKPVFHLKYDYFEWVNPMSEPIMYGILGLMTICALCIAAGFLYRVATGIFCLGFTYFMLIEQSHYNNHFYLFVLLLGVMFFMDADRMYSISSKRKPNNGKIPYWNHFLLTFLLFITYFYGGIAKLSPDWIGGLLPQAIVNSLPPTNFMKGFLGAEGFAKFLQYGGVLFDLSIGFFLLYKPTRWFAVIGVLIFNYTNGSVLFSDIGYFPLFMVCATILFFEPDFVEKLFAYGDDKKRKTKKSKNKTQANPVSKSTPLVWNTKRYITTVALGLFIFFQLLVPFRHFLYPGIPEWTGENMRFSWRMKMQTKSNEKLELKFKDIVTQEELRLPIEQHLTGHQLQHIIEDPNYLVQLAKYFKKASIGRDLTNVVVRADVETSFNGRKVQKMINPQVDLSVINPREGDTSWIIPLAK